MISRAGSLERLKQMVYVTAELDPRAITTVPRDSLPDGWDRRPPGFASQRFGDGWLSGGLSVALCVPSIVLPEGSNYVLNPTHPDFERAVRISPARPLNLDPRITERNVG